MLNKRLSILLGVLLISGVLLFVFSQSTIAQGVRSVTPAAFSCEDVTEIPQAECEALVALYNNTNGTSWTIKSGWLENNTPCAWYGVFCFGRTHVYNLLLPSNNLEGTLPPEFWNLTALTSLVLYDNKLSGNIPPAIGNLAHVRNLLLDHNRFAGVIPPEIGLLTSLDLRLELDSNQLTGAIPPELANLTNLRVLELQFNQLSGGVPSELGSMASLQALYLYYNSILSGPLPQSLTNLNLQFLGFDNTNLCEPGNAAFQAWLEAIPSSRRTAVCADANGFISQYMGGALTYTDTTGSRVTISAPLHAVTETTYLVYTKAVGPPGPNPGFAFAGISFGLEAYQNGVHQHDFAFQRPISVTIAYTDAQIDGLDESSLTLDYETESGWVDAATTCNPVSVYGRNPAENLLNLNICHLSRFALFAHEEPMLDQRVYLPLALKALNPQVLR